ncbi:MAG TPA: SpoIID/LytB domain-containing protein [Ruminiclostridium sp.]
MKKICLFLCTVLLFLTLSGVNSSNTYAATNPTVKIGLYYNSTAQCQIDISADKGVSFSAFDSIANKDYPVYSSGAGEVITIRKDSYYTNSGLKFTSVIASNNPTTGPFHIQIQNTFNTYNDTLPIVQSYIQKGVAAYPVYTDSGWNVWAGFYINKAAAEAAIVGVKTKLGENVYTVIEQVDTRIYGVNNLGNVKFMYASVKNLLRGKSLSTENPNPIKIGTAILNSFRGQVEFLRKTGSDMTIINVLPLEEYLYGVVPNEIEAYSNVEALKAQAIAARTYSYKSINKHASSGFNLCSTTDCHVYKGENSESPITNKVVDDTKDMVVTYNGSLVETVYFSSSGGKTEAAVNVWGSSFPYLQSVEDKYESGKSYQYNWKLNYTIDEVNQKLKSYNIGTVTGMEITKCSEAGRPIEIIVRGTLKPEGIVISKDKCRTFLGLYSQLYTMTTDADINISVNNQKVSTQLSKVTVITATGQTTYSDPAQQITIIGANGASTTVSASPTEYDFIGKGWGHAVGMSQEGAKGYANAGYTYDWILEHYYTGTEIELKK